MPLSIGKRAAIWIALAISAVALMYGFVTGGLFQQPVWSAMGWLRFEIFTVVFAVISTAILATIPSRYVTVSGASIILISIAAVGFAAVIAPVLFLAASYAVGRLVHRESGLVAIVTGIAIYIFVWQFLVQLPVNYALVYLLVFAVPLLVNRGAVAEMTQALAHAARPVRLASVRDRLAAGVLTFVVVIQWLMALKPETSGDGLAMHLAIPTVVAHLHRWPFDAKNLTYAVMPMGGDWCYTAVYLVGGEFAARLLNLAFLLLTAALLYVVVRRWLSTPKALLIAALWIGTPLAQLVTGALFVENSWALVTTAAFVSLLEGALLATPILLGTGMFIKLGSIAFIIPLMVAAPFMRKGERRRTVAAFALFLVFAAPAYITAFVRTGNPIFPFANDKFRSPYFDATTAFRDPRFHEPLSLQTLYDVTIHTSKYFEAQNGAFGYTMLLLLPAAVVALILVRAEGRRVAATAFLVAVAFWITTFASQANARYLYPVMPLMLIAVAYLMQASAAATVTALASLALNLYFLPAAGWYHKDFLLLTEAEREDYIRVGAPVRRLIEYMNLTHPGEPVMFIESDQFAGLNAPIWSDTWRHQNFQRKWNSNTDPKRELDLAHSVGVQYFIAPAADVTSRIGWIGTRTFLATCTEPEFRYGGYYIARLKRDFTGADADKAFREYGRRFGAVGPGMYDDTHPAVNLQGAWTTDQGFPTTLNHTVAYSNTPGDSFTLQFEGTAVTWVFTKAENRGVASVNIDGRNKAIVDLYSRDTQWQSRMTFGNLPAGKHEITVIVLDQKNPASKDRYVDLDGFEVSSTQVR